MTSFDTENYESVDYDMREEDPKVLEWWEQIHADYKAYTLDEYIRLSMDHCINVEIDSNLLKYLIELLDDPWFHQWPLLRWTYASNLLRGTWCARDVERAIDILLPMADEGMPGALHDIGYCYMYGLKWEKSYQKAISLWIQASSKDYRAAQNSLKFEYENGDYKSLPEELRLSLLREILRAFMRDKDIKGDNISCELDEKERKKLIKLKKEIDKLTKFVVEKERMRDASSLFWNEDENPYKLSI